MISKGSCNSEDWNILCKFENILKFKAVVLNHW